MTGFQRVVGYGTNDDSYLISLSINKYFTYRLYDFLEGRTPMLVKDFLFSKIVLLLMRDWSPILYLYTVEKN